RCKMEFIGSPYESRAFPQRLGAASPHNPHPVIANVIRESRMSFLRAVRRSVLGSVFLRKTRQSSRHKRSFSIVSLQRPMPYVNHVYCLNLLRPLSLLVQRSCEIDESSRDLLSERRQRQVVRRCPALFPFL